MTIGNFTSRNLPLKSKSKVVAKSYWIEEEDGSLSPFNGSGGGLGGTEGSVRIGNITYNVANFINTKHGAANAWNGAIVKTNIKSDAASPTFKDYEFQLKVVGQSFISAWDAPSLDPDGRGRAVQLLASYGYSGGAFYADHIVTQASPNVGTPVMFYKDKETGNLCIGFNCRDKLAQFQIDCIGGSLSEGELSGWTVQSVSEELSGDVGFCSKYGLVFNTSSNPVNAYQPAAYSELIKPSNGLEDLVNELQSRIAALEAK
ncbi:TPA: hypothetical protein PMC50_002506 [Vibrio cholerae]|nr:hypothetical protein [Vibrio cholerae]